MCIIIKKLKKIIYVTVQVWESCLIRHLVIPFKLKKKKLIVVVGLSRVRILNYVYLAN